ncbi:MAG: hypothetical protein ACFB02_16395 [Mastigocoleus sp.]
MIDLIFGFFLEFILWIFVGAIFYRFFYFTGKVITRLVTFGKYYPSKLIKDKELRKAQRAKGNRFTYASSKKKYLTVEAVSLIGFIFWLIAILLCGLLIYLIYN